MRLDAANDRCPVCDPATLESNVPGIYLAGVIVAGERTNEIFIENGRFHGQLIAGGSAGEACGGLEYCFADLPLRTKRCPRKISPTEAAQDMLR